MGLGTLPDLLRSFRELFHDQCALGAARTILAPRALSGLLLAVVAVMGGCPLRPRDEAACRCHAAVLPCGGRLDAGCIHRGHGAASTTVPL